MILKQGCPVCGLINGVGLSVLGWAILVTVVLW